MITPCIITMFVITHVYSYDHIYVTRLLIAGVHSRRLHVEPGPQELTSLHSRKAVPRSVLWVSSVDRLMTDGFCSEHDHVTLPLVWAERDLRGAGGRCQQAPNPPHHSLLVCFTRCLRWQPRRADRCHRRTPVCTHAHTARCQCYMKQCRVIQ